MKKNTLFLFICLLLFSLISFGQANMFSGTWELKYFPGPGMPPIKMQLQIAAPERNLLYPAQLTMQCDSFSGRYSLLLVKKSSRELAISRNKYPLSEIPFSLGDGTFFLNGIFDLSRDIKGLLNLHIIRIQSKQTVASIAPGLQPDTTKNPAAVKLRSFLKDSDIRLTKLNNNPWQDDNSVLSPVLSPAYFGLQDTVFVADRDATFNISGNKKNDIVSVSLNGNTLIDLLTLNKKPYTDDILLDTGLNMLILFADNFGDQMPNTGKLNLALSNKKINLDFTTKTDSAASFIVAKIYCDPNKAKAKYLKDYPAGAAEKLNSNDKLIGSVVATSHQVTLAIWDDAVEDGDSISITINGKWIARGFPVKKIPQFITVVLKPGPNTINFIADNLGTIPPNTSVLEIIDGIKRKSYILEANMGENNLIKIFYDVTPN